MSEEGHKDAEIEMLKAELATLREQLRGLAAAPFENPHLKMLKTFGQETRALAEHLQQQMHTLAAEGGNVGETVHPTAEDIFTRIIVCPSNDIAPTCAEAEVDETGTPIPYQYLLHPYCSFTVRMLWQVEWDIGCFWEHVVYMTIQNGRITELDFSQATDDDCRVVIVCAVDCEGGIVGA